jgi:hypothetical protein
MYLLLSYYSEATDTTFKCYVNAHDFQGKNELRDLCEFLNITNPGVDCDGQEYDAWSVDVDECSWALPHYRDWMKTMKVPTDWKDALRLPDDGHDR